MKIIEKYKKRKARAAACKEFRWWIMSHKRQYAFIMEASNLEEEGLHHISENPDKVREAIATVGGMSDFIVDFVVEHMLTQLEAGQLHDAEGSLTDRGQQAHAFLKDVLNEASTVGIYDEAQTTLLLNRVSSAALPRPQRKAKT